jgi:HAD superfamily hydrolase (TIGR01509 family)
VTPAPTLHAAEGKATQPIRAVIFDCDGTLVDSEGPALQVLHQLALDEGAELTLQQADRLFRGVRMLDCARWVAAQRPPRPEGFEVDFIRRVRAASEARFREGLQALPGAHDLLRLLASPVLALPFAVATNGPREKAELTLALTGLGPHFGEHVYCAYEVGSFKPDPGLFLHAARALGVTPAHCLVVEDSLTGLRAGLAAGMQVVALLAPAELPADLAAQVRCVAGLADVGRLLGAGTAPAS